MRYSAIIKFFAFVLCAAVIVTAIGSGAGLVALTECGLYNRSISDFYAEELDYKVNGLARQVARRYASLSLGGADKSVAAEFYPVSYAWFNLDKVGYVLKDADGTVLQTQKLDSSVSVQQSITTTVDGEYIKVLTREPVQEAPVQTEPADFGNANVLICPENSVEVSRITVVYPDGSQEDYAFPAEASLVVANDNEIRLYATAMPSLAFLDLQPGMEEQFPIHILFLGEDGSLVYEAIGDIRPLAEEYQRGGMSRILFPGAAYLLDQNAVTRPGTTISAGDFTAYDAIGAGETVAVSEINVSYGTAELGTSSSEGVAGEHLGIITHDEQGNALFTASEGAFFDMPEDMLITSITFQDIGGNLIYEANCPSGVGRFSYDNDGRQVFRANTPGLTASEETVPEVTEPVTETTLRGVVRKDTDVYSMPSLNGRKVGKLIAGTEVAVFQQEAIGDQNWVLVDQGWINMADVVVEQKAETGTEPVAVEPETMAAEPVQAVAINNIPVCSMPTLDKPVGELKKGDTVTVLKQESYQGVVWGLTEKGWVEMQWLTPETPVPVAVEVVPAFETQPIPVETIPGETVAVETIPGETLPPETVPGETIPGETAPQAQTVVPAETLPGARTVAVPEGEDPLAGYDPEEIRTHTYYDYSQDQAFDIRYVWEPLPEYTLELQLGFGADQNEMLWILLGLAYGLREYLLMILGGSLALLALCVVYICCAAAHKRGSNVIRAGGLNRIPLDGYLVLVGLGLTGMVLLGYEGTEYFIHNGLRQTGLGVLVGCAYACAALLVAIFFAFVAQIKTPGGYWWRNSLCGRCVLLAVRLCKSCVVFCGSRGWSLASRTVRGTSRVCLALWLFARKLMFWTWDTGKRLCLWAWDLVARLFRWTRGNLARLFGLLPITWQFLTTGFALVFFLYIMIRTYKVGYILLGFGTFFAVILYAASAFAILLENAKRMSRGDLDTKVDDRMLIGGFREFAQRLNDLAGVAVIAAQKQLKSERMKTELITNVSHDIKTPLTSIINYVDLLRKPHTQEQQEQYLEVLDRQSQRLKKLIDDLMEMSKASTGNLAVDIERVDAGEAVNQALGEFADKLEKAQLMPVFRQPDDQVYMMADGRLVWRVMSNLLGNAVKYALPGTRIYLDLMEMDGKVIISMKNISREELNVNADELMERFVRGDASRNTEGSGLGLNIAQSLMELQKGQLQILVDGDLFKVTLIFPAA